MAAVVGDFVPDLSRFRNMITGSSSMQQQQQAAATHESSSSACPSPKRVRSSKSPSSSSRTQPQEVIDPRAAESSNKRSSRHSQPHPEAPGSTESAGASRFPSPPSFSSPITTTAHPLAEHGNRGPMAPQDINNNASQAQTQAQGNAQTGPTAAATATAAVAEQRQQPSPPSDDYVIPRSTNPSSDPTFQSRQAPTGQTIPDEAVIHIRDLAHIQSLARDQVLGANPAGSSPQLAKYEISQMPIGDVIEMVAALLTKITTTNDLQHDAMQRNVTHQQQANQSHDAGGSSSMSPISHSVLAFHGKNVPAITILSYLARIHKYCPTTYEVFLSLLVYFDRMTERVNDMVVKSEAARRRGPSEQPSTSTQAQSATMAESDDVIVQESDSDLADDDDDNDNAMVDSPAVTSPPDSRRISMISDRNAYHNPATYFVVDSFNIHRLIISGVTCASKFFSDVFYTNSRYAKVGGLPLAELNHLELQFLILNDFRLAIPVEDLEAYGTMLVEFYAREVVARNTNTSA